MVSVNVSIITKIGQSWQSKSHVSEMNHKSIQSDRYLAFTCQAHLFLFTRTWLMPLFRCGFCTQKAQILCSISLWKKRSSSWAPAEFSAGNIQDRLARKRKHFCINLLKYPKDVADFCHIMFHLHDEWALHLFRLQGLKQRPIISSTILASYYSDKRTIAAGFRVQAFLDDITVIIFAFLLCP
jgi:hypothetical protein